RRGGLVDVEFIAQFLQLRHAADRPGILHPNTGEALARAAAAGILERAAADGLIAAGRLWRRLQGLLRLTVGDQVDEATALPEGLKRALAQAGGAADFAGLEALMDATATAARAQFERLIGAPEAA
ncbi:MAG: glutamine-synthetase adenylyltransferase, partial [Dongiaceae bacterium]